jgi:DNA-binding LacI/PurR family transcriptional regulator
MPVPVPNQRTITLKDVADASGVAISTVSRAFSNPERVSVTTRRLIEETARELGYEPRSKASVLGGDASVKGVIAQLLPNMTNPYVLDLIRGCQAQSQAAGYAHLLVNVMESMQLEADHLKRLSTVVDGIIVSSPRCDDAFLQRIAKEVPVVSINRALPGVPSVFVDTAAGMQGSIEHLAGLGHRHVAYVRGPAASWTDRNRFKAIQAATAARDIRLTPVGSFYPSLATGSAAADAVLLTDATAAVFFNDILALGALSRFRERGVDVPGDLSVIGCDDVFGASFSAPPLTTVTAPGEIIGHAATDLLITTMTKTSASRRTERFLPHLTIRGSTGPAYHRDPSTSPSDGEEPRHTERDPSRCHRSASASGSG